MLLNILSSAKVNNLLDDHYEQPNGERNPFILKSLISDKLSYPFGHIALGDEDPGPVQGPGNGRVPGRWPGAHGAPETSSIYIVVVVGHPPNVHYSTLGPIRYILEAHTCTPTCGDHTIRFLLGDAIYSNGSYLDQASVAVLPSSLGNEVESLFNVPPVKALYSTQVFNLTIAFVDFAI